jgi:hypothetical protein
MVKASGLVGAATCHTHDRRESLHEYPTAENDRGRFALRSGATLPMYDVYRDEAQSYDICDVHGKICF